MIEAIQNFFSNIFGNNIILATILIAMVPIIELKGAIPFSISHSIWKGLELSPGLAFLWGVIGSSLIVPLLVLVYSPLIKALKKTKLFKKIATKIEEKINTKKENVENKLDDKSQNIKTNKKTLLKVVSVFLFVAIPLPFTGVWTGSCLAVALGLNYFLSCFVVILGNIIAGLLVLAFSSLLTPLVYLGLFLVLILIFAVVFIIKKAKTKSKLTNQNSQDNNN